MQLLIIFLQNIKFSKRYVFFIILNISSWFCGLNLRKIIKKKFYETFDKNWWHLKFSLQQNVVFITLKKITYQWTCSCNFLLSFLCSILIVNMSENSDSYKTLQNLETHLFLSMYKTHLSEPYQLLDPSNTNIHNWHYPLFLWNILRVDTFCPR